MKILEVIPITKGIPQENLSYFTSKDVSIGALVSVPVKRKEVAAIVSAVSDARESKIDLKTSDFSIKPIKSVLAANFVTSEFLKSSEEIAQYYLSTPGAVIRDFIPQAILQGGAGLKLLKTENAQPASNTKENGETIVVQVPQEERIQYYKSLIREKFAKNKSVFLCFPNIAKLESAANELGRGIEKYVFILTGGMTKKNIMAEWKKTIEEKHPILIVATKLFFSIPRRDIGMIIMEEENSPAYKNLKKPYLDARKAAEIISRNFNARLVLGDDLVRTETFYRQKMGEFTSSLAQYLRKTSSIEQIILDAKKNFDLKGPDQKKIIATPELLKIVDETVSTGLNAKIVILTNRKGHTPITICLDCQKTLTCEQCDTPIVLYKTESKNLIRKCYKCFSQLPPMEQCPQCHSWRLESYGAGVQAISEEMRKFFPEIKVFEMDADNIKTKKIGQALVDDFLSSGGILIGTEMIFSYLSKPIDLAVIMSIDGLFTIPEFKINEKICRLALSLKNLTKRKLVIQTRLPENPIFSKALKGEISGFYKEEIENRKTFQYPPFKLLIKITKQGKDNKQVVKEMEALQKNLAEWNPIHYPAFIPKIKNLYVHHLLIKIDPSYWPPHPDKPMADTTQNTGKLRQILKALPPSWKIEIDPENLL